MTSDVIIFDVEGTLIDCVPHVLESWQRTLAEADHSVLRSDLQRYSGMDGNDMLARLLPDLTTSQRERLLKAQGERYRRDYLALSRPFYRAGALVKRLKDSGHAVGIATTCKGDELKRYDQHLDVLKCIDAVACGDDGCKGKPHPDLFYHAMQKLGITDPRCALAVGDTPYDALAAKPLGLRVVGVLTGGFSPEDLKAAGCDLILDEVQALDGVLGDEP
jgi:HAD superfamily hydrolase (TIGR01549 family)